MPVQSSAKLSALVADFGSQAKVADALQVDRSRVSRWLHGEEPDELNRDKVDGVEYVLSRLTGFYRRDTAIKWLLGFNPHLGNRRPIDLLRNGRVAEVLEAVEAEQAGAYA